MTTEKTLFDEVFMAALASDPNYHNSPVPFDSSMRRAILISQAYMAEREQLLKEVYGRG